MPVSIENVDDDASRLLLRCVECETYREVDVSRKQLSSYLAELRRGMEEIAGRLSEIDRERMRAQADAFANGSRFDVVDGADVERRTWG